jgi:tetratricopeptide (TPR) repeat protein
MSEGSNASGDSRPEEKLPGHALPEEDVHAWYQRGMELLGRGSPAAAAQVLQRASAAEPASRSVREALARAQFDAGRYAEAADNFRMIVEASPSDDYANFGLGLALARIGDHAAAAEYLALAAAMRPDAAHYAEALRSVRATLRARDDARTQRPAQADLSSQADPRSRAEHRAQADPPSRAEHRAQTEHSAQAQHPDQAEHPDHGGTR